MSEPTKRQMQLIALLKYLEAHHNMIVAIAACVDTTDDAETKIDVAGEKLDAFLAETKDDTLQTKEGMNAKYGKFGQPTTL